MQYPFLAGFLAEQRPLGTGAARKEDEAEAKIGEEGCAVWPMGVVQIWRKTHLFSSGQIRRATLVLKGI